MPLYEYKCSICNNYEEILEPLDSNNYHDCPCCKTSNTMQRQYSVPNVYESNNTSMPAVQPMPSCKGRGCDCPYAQ